MSQNTVMLFIYKRKRSTERTSARWEGPGYGHVSGGFYSNIFGDFLFLIAFSHMSDGA